MDAGRSSVGPFPRTARAIPRLLHRRQQKRNPGELELNRGGLLVKVIPAYQLASGNSSTVTRVVVPGIIASRKGKRPATPATTPACS